MRSTAIWRLNYRRRSMARWPPTAPIIRYSSLSKAYLAPGWRGGWMGVGRTERLDDALAAIKKLADGRLCSPGPMHMLVAAALTGDRSHQASFVRELKLRADLTVSRLSASPDLKVVAPTAAFYVMPQYCCRPGRTDVDFVLGLLRMAFLLFTGSGFNMPADQGFFRVVYLAAPDELSAIYDDLVVYARHFVSAH